MKRVTVTELKNRLSEFLRMVKRGDTIEVLERSIPIARIEAIAGGEGPGDGQLERLVFEGLVSRAKQAPDPKFLEHPPVDCDVDPVKVLIDQRGNR